MEQRTTQNKKNE